MYCVKYHVARNFGGVIFSCAIFVVLSLIRQKKLPCQKKFFPKIYFLSEIIHTELNHM